MAEPALVRACGPRSAASGNVRLVGGVTENRRCGYPRWSFWRGTSGAGRAPRGQRSVRRWRQSVPGAYWWRRHRKSGVRDAETPCGSGDCFCRDSRGLCRRGSRALRRWWCRSSSTTRAAASPSSVPSTATSTTLPARPDADALATCVPVSDHTGAIRGCVLRSELEAHQRGESHVVSLNVYDQAGNVVGYFIAGSTGFVNTATGSDPAALAEVQSCSQTDSPSTPVSAHCRQVLNGSRR